MLAFLLLFRYKSGKTRWKNYGELPKVVRKITMGI